MGKQAADTDWHVLVVDREPDVLELVRELLESRAYHVTVTTDTRAAFALVEALVPGMVIVDLAYGERLGFDLLQQLARSAATRGIPVLVTSTNPMLLAEAAADPARYGTHPELVKPFDVDDLFRTVASVFAPE